MTVHGKIREKSGGVDPCAVWVGVMVWGEKERKKKRVAVSRQSCTELEPGPVRFSG